MSDSYAVIGHPIEHSLSPRIHRLFALACQQEITYEAIDGGDGPESFTKTLHAFAASGGKGVNVTLPFKLQALQCASQAHLSASLCGAANALRLDGPVIEARNFDGAGLARDIDVNLQIPLKAARILLLGAGGAARGSILALAQSGAEQIIIANRTFTKAKDLAHQFQPHIPNNCSLKAVALSDCDFPDHPKIDIVINATSASLLSRDATLLSQPWIDALSSVSLAYDMVYGKGMTPFLVQMQQAGARLLSDGIGMLVEQAAEAFAWWRGMRPETSAVIAQFKIPLD